MIKQRETEEWEAMDSDKRPSLAEFVKNKQKERHNHNHNHNHDDDDTHDTHSHSHDHSHDNTNVNIIDKLLKTIHTANNDETIELKSQDGTDSIKVKTVQTQRRRLASTITRYVEFGTVNDPVLCVRACVSRCVCVFFFVFTTIEIAKYRAIFLKTQPKMRNEKKKHKKRHKNKAKKI